MSKNKIITLSVSEETIDKAKHIIASKEEIANRSHLFTMLVSKEYNKVIKG